MRVFRVFAAVVFTAVPVLAVAQGHGHAPTEAAVGFGIFPPALPLGDVLSGCAQTGIGGPLDPCAYKLHVLTPEETSIRMGGEVTFQVHGGGHAMAIYEVSKNTTRNDLGQFLCAGDDPATIASPFDHACNLLQPGGINAANANAEHIVPDGKGKVVLVAQANAFPNLPPNQVPHPDNRVWSPDGRLMSAGGRQFLVGGTAPAGADGQLVTYQFLSPGRYLVICMNRFHFLNDWMFGFVNVN